jgi:hypothetical protein
MNSLCEEILKQAEYLAPAAFMSSEERSPPVQAAKVPDRRKCHT